MPRRPQLEPGTYHVYNRWYEKMTIFRESRDYVKWYEIVDRLLFHENLEKRISLQIRAFCLLPNHFHFVLSGEGQQIQQFMYRLQLAYAKYFQTRYSDHRGPVFEWRYQAKVIEEGDDEYLINCISYVAYNPLYHDLVESIEDWPYTCWHQMTNGDSQTPKTPECLDVDSLQLRLSIDHEFEFH